MSQKTLWRRAVAPATTLPLATLDVQWIGGGARTVEDAPQLHDDESFTLKVERSLKRVSTACYCVP